MEQNNQKKNINKLKKSDGFSLTEVLVTLVICSILFAGMATHLVTSLKVYNSTILASEGQTLIDAVNTELTHMLRYSENVKTDSSSSNVVFTNKRTYKTTGGSQYYEYYIINEYIAVNDAGHLVHTDGTNAKDVVNGNLYNMLKISDFNLKYNDSTGIFTVSYNVKNGSATLRSVPEFSFARFGE